MKFVHRSLRWFRVEDSSGKLSLTTVAFAFALACIWTGHALSLTELGAFVTAVSAHRHRQSADAEAAAEAAAA
jgi:hypothetical protein